jgi:hypothetical protein
MRLRIVNEYLTLAAKRKVPQILCYNNDDADMMICNLLDDDKVIIQCLACNYSVKPGQAMYDFMAEKVRFYSGNPEELQASS